MSDTFPDGKSALTPMAARLKHVTDGEWGLPPLIERASVQGIAMPAANQRRKEESTGPRTAA